MSRRQRLITIRFFCDRAVPWPRQSTVFPPSRAVPRHRRDNLRSLIAHSHSCHAIIARVFSEHCRSIPDDPPQAPLEHSTNFPAASRDHFRSFQTISRKHLWSIPRNLPQVSPSIPGASPEHTRTQRRRPENCKRAKKTEHYFCNHPSILRKLPQRAEHLSSII